MGNWFSSTAEARQSEATSLEGENAEEAEVKRTDSEKQESKVEERDANGANDEKESELRELDVPQVQKEVSAETTVHEETHKKVAAAVKLQKVYRSYRTRRNFADWAVVIEELWWQAIEYATLTQSTEGFYNDGKLDTVESRWTRGKIKASKVGKGLSKDEKARSLAFQHWLEAIDPRHRYGHNLLFYYNEWYRQQTDQPFFYWLDVGDGKNVSLNECPRENLRKQRIQYLSAKEREKYEVIIKDGLLVYKHNMQEVHTPPDSKWIFVMSTCEQLYVGKKKRGTFQHSSFLAGAAILAAGRLTVDKGKLKAISRYSGHYLPTDENLQRFITFLEENGVCMADVEFTKHGEEMSYHLGRDLTKERPNLQLNQLEYTQDWHHGRNILDSSTTKTSDLNAENEGVMEQSINVAKGANNIIVDSCSVTSIDSNDKGIASEHEATSNKSVNQNNGKSIERKDQLTENGTVFYKKSLSSKDLEAQLPHLPCREWIERIHTQEPLKSGQLGKMLSCRWTSGTGLRIGCVAIYPPELRHEALKQVLSPRPTFPSGKRLLHMGNASYLESA
eukprot:TRINITY_DN13068_c0_g1_i1.p1 TRINITY_DN13068_c0_g1~~TRINITY_DN13068_c0_g1_i1.p1  ORF type:complete len:562 (-),score=124.67 TRINITY_DN13068_c0_g1_i1:289-1974(-)